MEEIPLTEIASALLRHLRGDWGREVRGDNDRALESGDELGAEYRSLRGIRFWIVTEADRSMTRVKLPTE